MAYAALLVPLAAHLLRKRASIVTVALSPLLAIPALVLVGLIVTLCSPIMRAVGIAADSSVQVCLGLVVCAGVGYVWGGWLGRPGASNTVYRRGAVITDGTAVQVGSRSDSSLDQTITLAGQPLTLADEVKHFKLIGTTGTGKTTAINEILAAALSRGDRAVIADPDGGYRQRFFDAARGDVVLNPFEPASLRWHLFGEIRREADAEQLARSFIPEHGEADRSWSEYGRTFFTALVQRCFASGIRDDGELYRLLTVASFEELRLLLAGTPAGPFLEAGNERMFGSIRSVTSAGVRALGYTVRQEAAAFSVRAWVAQGASRQGGGRGGVLFLPYKAGEIAALRGAIPAWLRLAMFEAMDRPPGDQRLWFVIDELDALGTIDGLKDALARLRKFGGRAVLGFQSISQVSSTYGRGVADTLVENCGNTLILRCSASEQGGTAQFASRLIGQREVLRTTRSRSHRPWRGLTSTTFNESIALESAFLASEVERLPDLTGLVKLASSADWRRVRLRVTERVAPAPVQPDNPEEHA